MLFKKEAQLARDKHKKNREKNIKYNGFYQTYAAKKKKKNQVLHEHNENWARQTTANINIENYGGCKNTDANECTIAHARTGNPMDSPCEHAR